MSTNGFPGSPRILKGALISGQTVIPFQYNPETLSRTITGSNYEGGHSDANELQRLKGPPQETISVEVQLDATDQLEAAEAPATTLGIAPMLAALEMLLYPAASLVSQNDLLASLGVIEVIAPESPVCLFAWGPNRISPVRLTELGINEEAFDVNLNPIRAKVTLTLKVLTYQDFGLQTSAGNLSLAQQQSKAVMATLAGSFTSGAMLPNAKGNY
jgi:hypothetical protein